MNTRKNQSLKMCFLLLCVGIIAMAQPVAAKSVYLSANHNAQTFDAWNIGSTGLVSKQGTYSLQYAFNPAGVAIDGLTGKDSVTLEPNPPLLFVTTEGAGGIEMINAVTLTFHGVFSAPINMGGLDADDADNILYAIQRGTSGYGGDGTSNLFIYTYNDDGTGMAQVASITLPNHGYGMSLALDDSRDILWVGDIQYNMVKAYDVNVSGVWSNIAEIPALSFSVSHVPVDVAVDSKRNIVYTSGGWYSSALLSKYEVETGVETTTNCGSPYPLGLAVDEFSGYVYMTRLFNDLAVWDCSTAPCTLLQDTPDLGTPAGIAIANGVGVNPYNLAKNYEIQGEGIWIGETFTYEITCDNVLHPTVDATGVKIRDDMPVELDYVSNTVDGAPGNGVYDAGTHTVLWDIGTIPAGQEGPLVKLVVHVNDNAVEGMTINNFANIWSNEEDTTTVDPQPDPDCDTLLAICDPGHVVPRPFIPVAFDIKPTSCPNPLNVGKQSNILAKLPGEPNDQTDIGTGIPGDPKAPVLPVAILGSADFDVLDIDPSSLTLMGEPAVRWAYEDVTTPMPEDAEQCECTTAGADGYKDLTIKFDKKAVIAALGPIEDGQIIPLYINGELYDGVPIEGMDCVIIRGKSSGDNSAPADGSGALTSLMGAHPNPFNPSTTISFSLATTGQYEITIYNITGQVVHSVSGLGRTGLNEVTWNGSGSASGVYFYRLTTADFTSTKKMVLLK